MMDRNHSADMAKQWQQTRSNIDIILLQPNVPKTAENLEKCRALDGMSHEERLKYIEDNWGSIYLSKIEPLLLRLRDIEKVISI